MRPIRRGVSPQQGTCVDYGRAKPDLVRRLGHYCSYCERYVCTNLAVEHIQPKGLTKYEALVGEWTNFLLACVNCNSTKQNKDVLLPEVLLPDRDNTAEAYAYEADGSITVRPALSSSAMAAASATLALVGLDKPLQSFTDENGRLVALDRVAQRMEGMAARAGLQGRRGCDTRERRCSTADGSNRDNERVLQCVDDGLCVRHRHAPTLHQRVQGHTTERLLRPKADRACLSGAEPRRPASRRKMLSDTDPTPQMRHACRILKRARSCRIRAGTQAPSSHVEELGLGGTLRSAANSSLISSP